MESVNLDKTGTVVMVVPVFIFCKMVEEACSDRCCLTFPGKLVFYVAGQYEPI